MDTPDMRDLIDLPEFPSPMQDMETLRSTDLIEEMAFDVPPASLPGPDLSEYDIEPPIPESIQTPRLLPDSPSVQNMPLPVIPVPEQDRVPDDPPATQGPPEIAPLQQTLPIDELPELPELTYAACHTTTTVEDTQCDLALIGVPIPVDLNGDLVPDVLTTVSPCGLRCVSLTMEAVPDPLGEVSVAFNGPAVLYLVYDTDPSDETEAIVLGGFDTLEGETTIPDTLQMTIEWSTREDGTDSILRYEQLGASAPLLLFTATETKEGPQTLQQQATVVDHEVSVPVTVNLQKTLARDTTDISYSASAAAGATGIRHSSEDLRQDHRIEYVEVDATPMPREMYLSASAADDDVAFTYDATSAIDRLDHLRVGIDESWEGAFDAITQATLNNLPNTIAAHADECGMELTASSATGFQFQQGRGALLDINHPYHVRHLNYESWGHQFANFAAQIDGLQALEADYGCSDGITRMSWALSEELPMLSMEGIVDKRILVAEIKPAHGHGFPQSGEIHSEPGRSFSVSDAGAPFGQMEFCISTTGHCLNTPPDRDRVTLQARSGVETAAGRLTGILEAAISHSMDRLIVETSYDVGGHVLEVVVRPQLPDAAYLAITGVPVEFELQTDLTTTVSFDTTQAVPELLLLAETGSHIVYTHAQEIPAGASFQGIHGAAGVGSIDANDHVGLIHVCFSSSQVCPTVPGYGFVLDGADIFTASVPDAKHMAVDVTNRTLELTLETQGGQSLTGLYREGGLQSLMTQMVDLPPNVMLTYDDSSDNKTWGWEADGSSGSVVVTSEAFTIFSQDVPGSAEALLSIGADNMDLAMELGAPMGTFFGCTSSATGAWASTGVHADEVESFNLTLHRDPQAITAEVLDNGSIGLLRASASDEDACGLLGESSTDFLLIDASNHRISTQIAGLRSLNATYTDQTWSMQVSMDRGRSLSFYGFDTSLTLAQIGNTPTNIKVGLDIAGPVKTFAYDGNGEGVDAFNVQGHGFLGLLTDMAPLTTVELDLPARTLDMNVSHPVTNLFIYGSMPGRTANLRLLEASSAWVGWTPDHSHLEIESRTDQPIGHVAGLLHQATGGPAAPPSWAGTFMRNEETRSLQFSVMNIRMGTIELRPEAFDVSLQRTGGQGVLLYWTDGPDFGYASLGTGSQWVEFQSDLRREITYTGSGPLSSLQVQSQQGSSSLMASATNVPRQFDLRFEPENARMVLDLESAWSRLSQGTFEMKQPGSPRMMFVQGSGLPEFTVQWSSDYKLTRLHHGAPIPEIMAMVDITGHGVQSIPSIGVHHVLNGPVHYTAMRATDVGSFDVDLRNDRLKADLFFGKSVQADMRLLENGKELRTILQATPGQFLIITDFMKSMTMSGSHAAFVYATANWSGHDFMVYATNVRHVGFVVQASSQDVGITSSGATSIIFQLRSNSIQGILGTGFRFIDGQIRNLPSGSFTIPFNAGGTLEIEPPGPVSSLEYHASRIGNRLEVSGDHLIWDRTPGRESINIRLTDLHQIRWDDSGVRQLRVDTAGGNPFLGYLIHSGRTTSLQLNEAPPSMTLNALYNPNGFADWESSATVSPGWFQTNDVSCGAGNIQMRVGHTRSMTLDWNFQDNGHFRAHTVPTVFAQAGFNICGNQAQLNAASRNLDVSWNIATTSQSTLKANLQSGTLQWERGQSGIHVSGNWAASHFRVFWDDIMPPNHLTSGSYGGTLDFYAKSGGGWWKLV